MAEQNHYEELSVMPDKNTEKVTKRESTSRIERLRQQYFENTPTLTSDRAVSITRIFKKAEGEPFVIRKAKALYDYCATKQ